MDTGRARVIDGAIASAVAALMLGSGLYGQHPAGAREVAGAALLAAGGLALVARRRAPRTVLAGTGLAAVGHQAAGFDVLAVSYLVAVYAAVRSGRRKAALATSAGLLAALHVAAALTQDGSAREVVAQVRATVEIAWLIAAFAAGEAVRQAERRADEAERTREETARRRADEERLRIARELHDALTHQISVIKVQSEAAVHVARRRNEQVPEALLAIRQAGREASGELRATLEALRDDDTAPPHGIDHVPGLVERFRAGGLDAKLTIEGTPSPVPAAVGRTAYRIVQESLTNTARHAATSTASVRIAYHPDTLTLRIADDGAPSAPPAGPAPSPAPRPGEAAPPPGEVARDAAPTPGLGLLGMHERVTALGGRLRAGPRAGGGFGVEAELPTNGAL